MLAFFRRKWYSNGEFLHLFRGAAFWRYKTTITYKTNGAERGFAALRQRKRPSLRHDFHEKGRLRHRQNPGQPIHPKAGVGGEGARREGQYSGSAAAV